MDILLPIIMNKQIKWINIVEYNNFTGQDKFY